MITPPFILCAVQWTEYERGWGQRNDGVSFHETIKDAEEYIEDYWRREKIRNPSGNTPDEYSAPEKPKMIPVSESIYRRVIFSGQYHDYQCRSIGNAITSETEFQCTKHQWSDPNPVRGKCINCSISPLDIIE